jgi:hypothetical protein
MRLSPNALRSAVERAAKDSLSRRSTESRT